MKGFTLIELLIVIGVLATLSVAVVVALNPAELLRQARDSNRLAELASLSRAISIVATEQSGASLGDPTKIYLSLPDDSSSACATYTDLLPPSPGHSYRCVTTASLRKTDGNGWIPINFQSFSSGPLLSALPVDPVNSAVSGYYYAYVGGSKYAVVALLESEKYLKQSAIKDGGTDDGRVEFGTDISLWADASGLKGLWRLDESTGGTIAKDSSGSGNNGVVPNVTPFVAGKMGNAVNFRGGVTDKVRIPYSLSLYHSSTTSILAWFKQADVNTWPIYGDSNLTPQTFYLASVGTAQLMTNNGGAFVPPIDFLSTPFPLNNWNHIALTWIGGNLNLYKDGVFAEQKSAPYTPNDRGQDYYIGYHWTSGSFKGQIDEVRVYDRPLSPAEIQATYKATR